MVVDGIEAFRLEKVGLDTRAMKVRVASPGGPHELRFDGRSDGQRALTALYAMVLLTAQQGYTLFLDEPETYVALYYCQTRKFCPSCQQKRAALLAEKLREEILAQVPHRHEEPARLAQQSATKNSPPHRGQRTRANAFSGRPQTRIESTTRRTTPRSGTQALSLSTATSPQEPRPARTRSRFAAMPSPWIRRVGAGPENIRGV